MTERGPLNSQKNTVGRFCLKLIGTISLTKWQVTLRFLVVYVVLMWGFVEMAAGGFS